ncbi:hypothetical protein DFH05DRAFT_1387170 [Lentinula detonsa]|uniref:Uncharacterized protein n=1 Tax=Lentinula detonsa TaxID=2804962 RepID=A0A9W8PB40_9AGAR|nr:hypothetical protein DFH05DRAFT_1387170 [Lentinula detonsa]
MNTCWCPQFPGCYLERHSRRSSCLSVCLSGTSSRLIIFKLSKFLLLREYYIPSFNLTNDSDQFHSPYRYADPASVIDGIIPSPLSVDVVGRVDATTTFVGQELNTEYLFGLFLQGADENTTQLIGTPRSVTIQSSVVEPPVAAVSFISEMEFSTVNMTVPLQIDMFISYDDDMKIVSYDAILRRVGEFMAYTVPYLAPQIAKELNSTTTNVTELIELKTATDVCAVSTQYCTGDNQQYESHDSCMSFMTSLSFGESWQGGMNTGWCRYIHKNMVKYRPEVHCPHIGPTGGDMCIDRNYVEVVDTNPFNQTLLAYNSSYNVADMKGIPANNVAELVKVQTEVVSMTTVAFVSYLLLHESRRSSIVFFLLSSQSPRSYTCSSCI